MAFQIVRALRLDGADNPLELVYFVEAGSGERLSAQTTAAMLNRLNLQRAAIVLGYRVHGILATRKPHIHTHTRSPQSKCTQVTFIFILHTKCYVHKRKTQTTVSARKI